MTDNVTQQLGERFWPLPFEAFFADEKAPPNPETGDGGMWFGNEMPPTYQEFLRRPDVVQAKAFQKFQILQAVAQFEQQKIQQQLAVATPKQRKRMLRELERGMAQAESSDSPEKVVVHQHNPAIN